MWFVPDLSITKTTMFMNNLSLDLQICEHKSSLDLFARKFTNDLDDANDLVQDTMIKAIKYASMFKEGTNLRAWLFTIMKNTFINGYKKDSRKNSLMDTTDDLTSAQLKRSAATNLGENKFMMDDINGAMKGLQPEYSTPFLMYFEGYKYHEIAEELKIPIGTVKTRIYMARQILKNNLKMYAQEFKKSA
jgi:RNA polymerase sigma factor (sigma-70 family)